MKHRLRKINFSMNQKIFCISALILLSCLLITGIFVYNHFRTLYSESLNQAVQLIMQNYAADVEDCFQRAENIGNLLNAEMPSLVPQLDSQEEDYEKYWTCLSLKDKLTSFSESTFGEDITYCSYLILREDFSISSLLQPFDHELFTRSSTGYQIPPHVYKNDVSYTEEWLQTAKSYNGEGYWFTHPDNSQFIWLARDLTDKFVVKQKVEEYSLGVLLIGIDISWITNYFDDNMLINDLGFFITDSGHRIIYAEDDTLINQNFNSLIEEQDIFPFPSNTSQTITMNGTSYRLWERTLPNEMHLLSFIPVQTFDNQLLESLYLFILLFVLVVAAGLILTAIFARIVTSPVRRLSSHMQSISAPTPIAHNYHAMDEMGILYRTFNEMTEKHNELIGQIYDYSEHQKQLKYALLQAQINPHFLYNTLDSVSCVALLHGEIELSDTLSSLALLLRYNINQPDQLVTLQDELDMVNDYISIQQFRCDHRIRFTCAVPAELKLTKLPKTLLQPLVENSIQYGSANADGLRYISIRAELAEVQQMLSGKPQTNIRIIICNEHGNTESTAEADIRQLNDYLLGKCELKRKNSGLGILNVQQRIQLVFGEHYGIHYEQQGMHVAAIICLPFFN